MAAELNHTIVAARDASASATFLAEILGLPGPEVYGPFQVVRTANGVSLDFQQRDGKIAWQHYAFLISEPEFDEIFGRIRSRGLPHWGDPFKQQPDRINHNDGGRGVYFEDPDGHMLEIITRPYGAGEQ
jgi:catechol 2,3-dioxygenase-like lactoylglutathione lyase family enzyme